MILDECKYNYIHYQNLKYKVGDSYIGCIGPEKKVQIIIIWIYGWVGPGQCGFESGNTYYLNFSLMHVAYGELII